MTSKKPEQNPADLSNAAEPKDAPAPDRPRGPTPEQLQTLTEGGSYTFDPDTGRFEQTRRGTALKDLKRA